MDKIPDKIFKSIVHCCDGFEKFSNGQQVEKGYKPDFVLRKGNEYIIFESENSSSRKMYVGGMLKAAHFLQNQKTGILIFVITPKVNTKVSSIANHLKPYFDWIKDKTNLYGVYVIGAKGYYIEGQPLSICSDEFINSAIKSLSKRWSINLRFIKERRIILVDFYLAIPGQTPCV